MKLKHFFNKTSIRNFYEFCISKQIQRIAEQTKKESFKEKLKQFQHNNLNSKQPLFESGRSMVEILGVLAVIGVLSIGGLVGYRYAMDKYRANDIINEVNMRGQDIWHRYQDQPLPEEITEWNTTTQTGYPIDIETVPDEYLFHVNVDQVESRVCKLVLQGQYQSVYAMVIQNEEAVIYDGSNLEICGNNDPVFMIFSFDTAGEYDSGHGLCITDDDCGAGCFYCSATHFCETHCEGTKGVCSVSKNACVECETTDQCPDGAICNDIDNVCETPVGTCAAGEFRSKNGKCVECSYAGNIIISPDRKFGDDTLTGEEMCAACSESSQARLIETADGTTYCSKTCTTGISYPSRSNGCISCDDPKQYTIDRSDQDTVDQCLACPDHYIWYGFVGEVNCGTGLNCPEGKFFGIGWGDFTPNSCKSCSDNAGYGFPSGAPEIIKKAKDSCVACPASAPRYISANNQCYPKCSQPDKTASIQTCKNEGPLSENCKRHWQGRDNGICYTCDTKDSAIVGTSGMYYDMCLNCGRKVNAKGYCYRGDDCAVGTFLGADGACWNCNNDGRVEIEGAEVSKCATNCKKDDSGHYSATGTNEGRFVHDKFCYKNCGEGYFNGQNGGCKACSARESWDLGLVLPTASEPFTSICTACKAPYERMLVHPNYLDGSSVVKQYCTLKNCPVFSDGKRGYHSAYGRCEACSTPGMAPWQGPNNVPEADCIACGNRFMLHNYCVLFNPGKYGVCNSIDNVIPDYIEDSLKQAAQPYLKGNYDGKKFRSQDGTCYSCDATANVNVGNNADGITQCKSCGNRRFANGTCIYGLCSESGTFLRESDWKCIKCGSGGKKVDIPSSHFSENLCNGCDGYRAMTTGTSSTDNLKTYCIKKCTDFEFEDINATCYDESSTTPSIEIGTDSDSIARCNHISNRTAVMDSDSGKAYCNLIGAE